VLRRAMVLGELLNGEAHRVGTLWWNGVSKLAKNGTCIFLLLLR
jgi:hypothetical protein